MSHQAGNEQELAYSQPENGTNANDDNKKQEKKKLPTTFVQIGLDGPIKGPRKVRLSQNCATGAEHAVFLQKELNRTQGNVVDFQLDCPVIFAAVFEGDEALMDHNIPLEEDSEYTFKFKLANGDGNVQKENEDGPNPVEELATKFYKLAEEKEELKKLVDGQAEKMAQLVEEQAKQKADLAEKHEKLAQSVDDHFVKVVQTMREQYTETEEKLAERYEKIIKLMEQQHKLAMEEQIEQKKEAAERYEKLIKSDEEKFKLAMAKMLEKQEEMAEKCEKMAQQLDGQFKSLSEEQAKCKAKLAKECEKMEKLVDEGVKLSIVLVEEQAQRQEKLAKELTNCLDQLEQFNDEKNALKKQIEGEAKNMAKLAEEQYKKMAKLGEKLEKQKCQMEKLEKERDTLKRRVDEQGKEWEKHQKLLEEEKRMASAEYARLIGVPKVANLKAHFDKDKLLQLIQHGNIPRIYIQSNQQLNCRGLLQSIVDKLATAEKPSKMVEEVTVECYTVPFTWPKNQELKFKQKTPNVSLKLNEASASAQNYSGHQLAEYELTNGKSHFKVFIHYENESHFNKFVWKFAYRRLAFESPI